MVAQIGVSESLCGYSFQRVLSNGSVSQNAGAKPLLQRLPQYFNLCKQPPRRAQQHLLIGFPVESAFALLLTKVTKRKDECY